MKRCWKNGNPKNENIKKCSKEKEEKYFFTLDKPLQKCYYNDNFNVNKHQHTKTVTKTVGSTRNSQRAADGGKAAGVGFFRISLCSCRLKGYPTKPSRIFRVKESRLIEWFNGWLQEYSLSRYSGRAFLFWRQYWYF